MEFVKKKKKNATVFNLIVKKREENCEIEITVIIDTAARNFGLSLFTVSFRDNCSKTRKLDIYSTTK